MASVFNLYAARMLQFSVCLSACISLNAWADNQKAVTLPSTPVQTERSYDQVISLPQKTELTPRPAIADQAWWVSAGVGGAHVSTYNAFAFNLGVYGSADRFVYGFRYNANKGDCGSDPCHDIRYGNEQALILGSYLDQRHMTWAGAGIARVDSAGGRHPDQQHIDIGLPLEFVFSPPGRYLAPELRVNVDLNKYNSLAMITIGARFGELK